MNKTVSILLRFSLGFIFLWAFLDKTFGLGFATPSSNSWINGGSPTSGFLSYAVKGPFASFFQSLSGNNFVDLIFMAGLLFIGLTLILNRFVVWGSVAGLLMVVLMYLAVLPPENNPVIDDHIIYAILFAHFIILNRKKESSI